MYPAVRKYYISLEKGWRGVIWRLYQRGDESRSEENLTNQQHVLPDKSSPRVSRRALATKGNVAKGFGHVWSSELKLHLFASPRPTALFTYFGVKSRTVLFLHCLSAFFADHGVKFWTIGLFGGAASLSANFRVKGWYIFLFNGKATSLSSFFSSHWHGCLSTKSNRQSVTGNRLLVVELLFSPPFDKDYKNKWKLFTCQELGRY